MCSKRLNIYMYINVLTTYKVYLPGLSRIWNIELCNIVTWPYITNCRNKLEFLLPKKTFREFLEIKEASN